MPTKHVPARIKATAATDASLAEGQFVALASVFNNVDAYGDVVMPGAFQQDLTDWKASGEVMPVYWSHRMDDPNMCIGSVMEAAETADGLQVKVALDLDNPQAQQVHRLMKAKRVNRMSFAYDIQDAGWGERDGDTVYELRQLKVHEVSVVQVPANPAAVVQEVKAANGAVVIKTIDGGSGITTYTVNGEPGVVASLKVGRALSSKNEDALKGAIKAIQSVLDSIDSSDDGKAAPSQPAPPEEPHGAKGDQPAGPGPASVRLLHELGIQWAEFDQLADQEVVH
jgi:HK97 family phage prohead protease